MGELVSESRKAGASPGGSTILSRASTDHGDGAAPPPGTALSAVQVQQLWLARLLRDDALSVSSYCEEEANESPRSQRRKAPAALLSRVLRLQRLAPLGRTPSLKRRPSAPAADATALAGELAACTALENAPAVAAEAEAPAEADEPSAAAKAAAAEAEAEAAVERALEKADAEAAAAEAAAAAAKAAEAKASAEAAVKEAAAARSARRATSTMSFARGGRRPSAGKVSTSSTDALEVVAELEEPEVEAAEEAAEEVKEEVKEVVKEEVKEVAKEEEVAPEAEVSGSLRVAAPATEVELPSSPAALRSGGLPALARLAEVVFPRSRWRRRRRRSLPRVACLHSPRLAAAISPTVRSGSPAEAMLLAASQVIIDSHTPPPAAEPLADETSSAGSAWEIAGGETLFGVPRVGVAFGGSIDVSVSPPPSAPFSDGTAEPVADLPSPPPSEAAPEVPVAVGDLDTAVATSIFGGAASSRHFTAAETAPATAIAASIFGSVVAAPRAVARSIFGAAAEAAAAEPTPAVVTEADRATAATKLQARLRGNSGRGGGGGGVGGSDGGGGGGGDSGVAAKRRLNPERVGDGGGAAGGRPGGATRRRRPSPRPSHRRLRLPRSRRRRSTSKSAARRPPPTTPHRQEPSAASAMLFTADIAALAPAARAELLASFASADASELLAAMPPAAVAAAAKTLGAVATGRGGESATEPDAGAEAVPPAESKAAEAAAAYKSELLGGFAARETRTSPLLGAPTQGFFDYGPGYLLGCAARPFAPCMRLLGSSSAAPTYRDFRRG